MARLRILVALFLVLAWLPASQACNVSVLLQDPACCCDDAHADGSASEENCPECVTLKSGSFSAARLEVFLPVAHHGFTELAVLAGINFSFPVADEAHAPPHSPPERQIPLCIFVSRTALPARAPAFC